MNFKKYLTPGIALRMMADAGFVLASLAVAVAVRLFVVLAFELPVGESPGEHVRRAMSNFLHAALPLTLILMTVFWLNGFYTYSKNYLGRYRALVVLQAVSVGFLLYGFLAYFLAGKMAIPRGSLLGAWVLASGLLIGARLWNVLWNRVVVPEREVMLRERGPVERVLVIGGAGYIGSALVPILLREGYSVRVLDMLLFGKEPLQNCLSDPRLELIQGDFRNVDETLYRAMQGIDAVVHLGAIVGDPACKLDEELTIHVNLISTKVIADVARLLGVKRFVFASTCSVYGASPELLDERSETRPLSLYGRTKLASERVLLDTPDHRLAPVILRFATIYGLSGRTRFDLVVNLLAARARLEGTITVHGGSQWRPFIHVQDAARGILAVLQAPATVVARQIFNVGSDEQNYTIQQIGELVRDRVHGSRLVVDDENQDLRNYRVSFRKICQQLEFRPQWGVAEGIQQVLEAIATGEIVDYEDPRYSNAKYLSLEGVSKLEPHLWAKQLLQGLPD